MHTLRSEKGLRGGDRRRESGRVARRYEFVVAVSFHRFVTRNSQRRWLIFACVFVVRLRFASSIRVVLRFRRSRRRFVRFFAFVVRVAYYRRSPFATVSIVP